MKKIKSIVLSLSLLALSACGSGIQTQGGDGGGGNGLGNKTTETSFKAATANQNVFSLGSDFPTDIQIPSHPELQGTAFIATDSPSLGVVPVDLDTKKFSTKFKGLDAQAEGVDDDLGWAKKVKILSPTQGFMLGGLGLVYFNPTTGKVYESWDLTQSIQISAPLDLSYSFDWDKNGQLDTQIDGSVQPTAPDNFEIIDNRLFVSLNNYFNNTDPLLFVQAMILVFDLEANPPFLHEANPKYVALDGFNATALSQYQGKLLITLSGATSIVNDQGVPLTDSKLIKLDPQSLQIEDAMNLGKIGANYQSLAIRPDGRAFLGSWAFSQIYEINLKNWTVVHGKNNPIQLSGEAHDYITDQKLAPGGDFLFVASLNRSSVQAISLQDEERKVLDHALDYQFEENPGITGAGPMAIRPGTPGEDFEGADLWLLTAFPGTLSNAVTY